MDNGACVVSIADSGWHVGRVLEVSTTGQKKRLFELGWGLTEKGIETGEPYLVAIAGKNTLVVNAVCPPTFPKMATAENQSETGNVLLFKMDSGTFVNLTRLDGREFFAEAVAYVPEEDVIVAVKSKLVANANYPMPAEGNREPLYLNLAGETISPDKCPRAVVTYAEYVKLRPMSVKSGDESGWRIDLGAGTFLMGKNILKKPAVHFMGNGLWSISSQEIGTYLAKPGDAILVKVSQSEVVGCDADGGGSLLFRQVAKDQSPVFNLASIRSLLEGVREKMTTFQPSEDR